LTDRARWLADRRQGIGGSDVGAVLGVSPWSTPWDVWLDKTGRAEPQAETPAMRRGTLFESGVIRAYCEDTGRKVGTLDQWAKVVGRERFERYGDQCVLVGAEPWQRFTPDGLVVDESRRNAIGGLEVKVTMRNDREKGWGAPGSDQVPPHYLCQVLYGLAVTGLPWFDLVVWSLLDDRADVYRIPARPSLQAAILARVSEFWELYVVADEPPPVDTSNGAAGYLATVDRDDDLLEPTEEALDAADALLTARRDLAEVQAREAAQLAALKAATGSHKGIRGVCAWTKPNKRSGRRSFRFSYKPERTT